MAKYARVEITLGPLPDDVTWADPELEEFFDTIASIAYSWRLPDGVDADMSGAIISHAEYVGGDEAVPELDAGESFLAALHQTGADADTIALAERVVAERRAKREKGQEGSPLS